MNSLPDDLVAFLDSDSKLDYDGSDCEAGIVTLKSLPDLRLQQFPMETGSLDNFADDPNYPSQNSYLVHGVDLIASCTGDYDPVGLLIWFPGENRYGTWDCSHCYIALFPSTTTWKQIIESPAGHLNAQWIGMDPAAPPTEPLIPWTLYEYAGSQFYRPLDIE